MNSHTDAEDAGQIVRRRGGDIVAAKGKKSREEQARKEKDVIYDERSHYIYENKQKVDNFPGEKDDISTQLDAIYTENTRILLRSTVICHDWSAGERTIRFKK